MIKLNIIGHKSPYISQLEKTLSLHSEHQGTINIKVVGASTVQSLNTQYADKPESTDVLSFSYLEDDPDASELGDVVISQEHIKRQAKEAGTSEETEFVLLALHGSLHILGYDHHKAEDLRQMDKLQQDIMQELGLKYRNFGWHKPKT